MKIQHITLDGEIKGGIWWPHGQEFTKRFSVTFEPQKTRRNPFHRDWTGIRDALLHITNDGDFEYCAVSALYGHVTYWDDRRKKEIIKYFRFNPSAQEYSDLLTEDCWL